MSTRPTPLVDLRGVTKAYARGPREVVALCDLTLQVDEGESVAIMGPSGSGKSTLLSIVGCLDRPTRGTYLLAGRPVAEQDDRTLSRTRGRSLGFVFQSFHLIPQLTVAENVETPLLYGDTPPSEWRRRALASLERVGLLSRADHRPAELSGGEAQRAAIARALVAAPPLILADEPTGNLDSVTGEEIADLLWELNRDGHTLLVVTHNADLGARAARRIHLRDGRLDPPPWARSAG